LNLRLVFLIALSFASVSYCHAEQKYYTWVDAQGNVHNTPVPTNSEENKSTADSSAQQQGFLTEDEFNAEAERKKQENPAFYTWTDAEGRVVNSVKPEVLVEFTEQEVVADFVFAPPFRLPPVITEGKCCAQYQQAFSGDIQRTQVINKSSFFYKTLDGEYPAAYLKLKKQPGWFALKLFGLDDEKTIELVLLNEAFKPIYLASRLSPLKVDETWSHHGYKKLILELNDAEAQYLVLFSADQGGEEYKVSLRYDLNDL